MKEPEARTVLLVKAIELAPQGTALLSEVQRQNASEVALAACPRPSSESKRNEWAERFLAKRATRLLDEATVREPRVRWLQRKGSLVQVLTLGLPCLALVTGFLTERWGSLARIDLLSPALLGLLIWNWGIFVLIVGAALRSPFKSHIRRPMIAAALHNVSVPRHWTPKFLPILASFQEDWLQLAGRTMVARVASVLHLSAAVLAAGMVLSLLWMGIRNEYHVGWESQVVSDVAMHRLFTFFAWLVGMDAMTASDIERLHHWSASSLEDGGYWFELLTRLVLFTVIVPRLLLAMISAWSTKCSGSKLKLDLSDPYFTNLLSEAGGSSTQAVVYPYSFTISAALQQGLHIAVKDRLGKRATLQLVASTAYGEELIYKRDAPPPSARDVVTKAIALFSMSATPEKEAHGEFVQQLWKRTGTEVEVWVDTSAFEKRLGSTGGTSSRVAEREALWQEFAAQFNTQLRVVNLERSQPGV